MVSKGAIMRKPYFKKSAKAWYVNLDGRQVRLGILMGHADATMVMRVYSHLTQNDEFLQQKLAQATGEKAVG
jgi:hypothetical protein